MARLQAEREVAVAIFHVWQKFILNANILFRRGINKFIEFEMILIIFPVVSIEFCGFWDLKFVSFNISLCSQKFPKICYAQKRFEFGVQTSIVFPL